MSETNDPAAEARKKQIAGAYTRAAEGFVENESFVKLGRRLAELGDIRPGARVLDVACGRGAVMFPAAELTGPAGHVTGVDLAEGMVQATTAEIAQRRLRNVMVRVMDAENLVFPGASFDRVLCGFGIFFLPHPYRGLAEFRRVLVPGGRLAMTTWGPIDPRWVWRLETERRYLPPEPEPPPDSAQEPAPDFRTPSGMAAFLSAGGFEDIRVVSEETEHCFPSAEEWWSSLWTHGTRIYLEKIEAAGGPAALERYKAEAFERLETFREPCGYPERRTVHFSLAAKPPG